MRRHIPDALKARAVTLRVQERLGIDAIRDATGLSVGTLSTLLRDYPLSASEVAAARTAGRVKVNETRWGQHTPQRDTKPVGHPARVRIDAYRVFPEGHAHRLLRGEARALVAARGLFPVTVQLGLSQPYEVRDAFRLRSDGSEQLVFVTVGMHDEHRSVVLGSDVLRVRGRETPQWVPLSEVAMFTYRDIARELLQWESRRRGEASLACFLSTNHAAVAVRRSGQLKPVLGEQWVSRMWGQNARSTLPATDIPSWSIAQSRVLAVAGARVRVYVAPAPITAPRVRAGT